MKGFRRLYRTMSVKEAIDRRMGTCIEQAAMAHHLLGKIGVPSKLFCCRIFEPDDYGNLEEDEHMHCFVLFWRDGQVCQLESISGERRGITAYPTEAAAMEDIVRFYVNLRGGKPSPTTLFDELPAGLTFREFNAYINHLTA